MPDQTSFISDDTGKIVVSKVLRLESLAEQWPEIPKRLGLPSIPLLHLNKGEKRDGGRDAVILDETSKSLIAEIYSRDFRNFGYPQS